MTTMMVVMAAAAVLLGLFGVGFLSHREGVRMALRMAQADVDTARQDAAAARKTAAEQIVAAAIAQKHDEASQQLAAELRADLKDSERKRLEVGACIGQVVEERQVWEDLYFSLMTGCSRAQHWLALECERLSKLAGKPIAPQVQQVLRETQELFDRGKPAATPLVTMQAKIDAVTAPPADKAPRA